MDLAQLTELLNALGNTAEVFSIQDVVLTTVLSFVLALVIGRIYKITHRSASYTQSYVHTLVIMSMVVAIIMLIVGSNIARAFSLVGALSIIRFRNAMKETRDVGFIFFAMAVGMACGTRFYLLAVISTLVISFLIWAMVRLDLFAKDVREQILKVRVHGDLRSETLFDKLFAEYLTRFNLVAMETVQAGTLTELVYSVEFKKKVSPGEFMAEVQKLNGNNKVVLITGQHEVDL